MTKPSPRSRASYPNFLPENLGIVHEVKGNPGEDTVPAPKYRHAAPSAPWPWMDFAHDKSDVPHSPQSACGTWTDYPQSCFANWTKDQVERCRMLKIRKGAQCVIYNVDILANGKFSPLPRRASKVTSDEYAKTYWNELQREPEPELRMRALFIEDISLNALKILGTKFDIEPFFFSSSANWIASRYQEDPQKKKGDHITVVLPFIRTSEDPNTSTRSSEPRPMRLTDRARTVNVQVPLILSDTRKVLLPDLLAIHMIRKTECSTIISYHHYSSSKPQDTTASLLQSLVHRTGDSVYWQKIYEKSKDPTFVFLAILWWVFYAWDEALEEFYKYLSCYLDVANVAQPVSHTRHLHVLQAHLLYYQRLLIEFKRSVEFVRDTHNPAMDHDSIFEDYRKASKELLQHESTILLSEVQRLEEHTQLLSAQLRNTMKFVVDEATMRDSTAMRQIAYLTTLFLPAGYLLNVFGSHVAGIDITVPTYVVSTIVLMMVTVWIVVALDEHSPFHTGDRGLARRVAWPLFCGYSLIQTKLSGKTSLPDAFDRV